MDLPAIDASLVEIGRLQPNCSLLARVCQVCLVMSLKLYSAN